ncbi:MAG: ATP-binding cassette domain-containing protein, partial [Clostridia bacterium]|nr:ATP-binding cassette domain-containing protein [Clostridia bacterium]
TSFTTAIIIYYVGIDVMQGISSYAKIMLLMEYGTNQLKYEFNWFIKHLTDYNKSFFAYSKILDFLNINDVEDLESGEELENISSIRFKNVYFSYNSNQKNIKDFCLNLEHGEKVALVGKTGSGKTTITSLLCRFYEPIKGEILINNKNYKKYKISSLRKRIGYVMQEVEIFPNTIIDNIKYINKDISIEEIKDIFKKLKLHNKIENLEYGYNTDIYNNPDILSTRRKTINKFCKNNGNRHRCNYFR